jgi:hypothetical protein
MTRMGQAARRGHRHPGFVTSDASLNELVFFEIPGVELAAGLCELLGADRLAWVQTGDGVRRVAVLIQPEECDLAAILRAVEQWIAENGLVAIRFELDGRIYVLESGESIWSTAAA